MRNHTGDLSPREYRGNFLPAGTLGQIMMDDAELGK